MQYNELRSGIYVNIRNWDTLFGMTDFWDICKGKTGIDDIKPIELTEEWLLKFGFQVFPWGWVKKSKSNFGIRLSMKTYSYEVEGNSPIKLNYVHELQSLYLALTKEELELLPV